MTWHFTCKTVGGDPSSCTPTCHTQHPQQSGHETCHSRQSHAMEVHDKAPRGGGARRLHLYGCFPAQNPMPNGSLDAVPRENNKVVRVAGPHLEHLQQGQEMREKKRMRSAQRIGCTVRHRKYPKALRCRERRWQGLRGGGGSTKEAVARGCPPNAHLQCYASVQHAGAGKQHHGARQRRRTAMKSQAHTRPRARHRM
jgi:hypothetical protein